MIPLFSGESRGIAICLVLLWGSTSGLHAQTSSPQPSSGEILFLTEQIPVRDFDGTVVTLDRGTAVRFLSANGDVFTVTPDGVKRLDLPKDKLNSFDMFIRTIVGVQQAVAVQQTIAAQQAIAALREREEDAATKETYRRMAEQKYQEAAQLQAQVNLGLKVLDVMGQELQAAARDQQASEKQRQLIEQQAARQQQQTQIQQQQIIDRQQEILFRLGKVHRPGMSVVLPPPKEQAALWREYLQLQMSRTDLPEQARQQASYELAAREQEQTSAKNADPTDYSQMAERSDAENKLRELETRERRGEPLSSSERAFYQNTLGNEAHHLDSSSERQFQNLMHQDDDARRKENQTP